MAPLLQFDDCAIIIVLLMLNFQSVHIYPNLLIAHRFLRKTPDFNHAGGVHSKADLQVAKAPEPWP